MRNWLKRKSSCVIVAIVPFVVTLGLCRGALADAKDGIVLKNLHDLTWEQMLPALGADSPRFAILRVDPKTHATTLMIEFPKAMHIPKHTHTKSETHIILGGSHTFDQGGKRFEVETQGYIYMPGEFVHEAWVPAGARAIIVLEDGWKVDWVGEGPTIQDLGKVIPELSSHQ